MKKIFVVGVLFALPIVAYLFFASGVNDFARLPVLNEEIGTLKEFEDLDGDEISLEGNITILGFYGENPEDYTGNAFNLSSKIYDTYYKFKDFQLVIAVPHGSEGAVRKLKMELEKITNPLKWKFAFGSPEAVMELHQNLGTTFSLNEDLGSPYVFIIDKDGHLRGRDDDEDVGMLYGYDTRSVAELDDKMDDDVKVILAEYRLALKKYNSERKK